MPTPVLSGVHFPDSRLAACHGLPRAMAGIFLLGRIGQVVGVELGGLAAVAVAKLAAVVLVFAGARQGFRTIDRDEAAALVAAIAAPRIGWVMYTYEYPRPAVSVDVVVLDVSTGTWRLLLIQRLKDPFAGRWALPGGFLEMDETLETAARRELREETELEVAELIQLGAYSAVDRDPRGRVISVAFLAIVTGARDVKAGDDAQAARWHAIDRLPPLAFDHDQIVEHALNRYRDSRFSTFNATRDAVS